MVKLMSLFSAEHKINIYVKVANSDFLKYFKLYIVLEI